MNPSEQELQRRVLGARARLREGFTTRQAADDLVRGVAQKRGERAAEQLREDMRDQWRVRRTWLNDKNAVRVT